MKVLGLLLVLFSLNAMAIPVYYWDNDSGFTDASHCNVSFVNNQNFRVSRYFGTGHKQYENLRNSKGARLSYLKNGSLVKLDPNGITKDNYKRVEVAGINQRNTFSNRYLSERGDKGYLFEKSLIPAEDYVFELMDGTPTNKLGNTRDNAVGTYLKLAATSAYYKLECLEFKSSRDYVLFNMYEKENNEKPIALIGLYWDETKLLSSIKSYTKAQIYPIINTIIDETPIEQLLNENDINDVNNQDAQDNQDDQAPTVVVVDDNDIVDGTFQDVVCIDNDTLAVRDESLDNILFRVGLGERVKIFQGFEQLEKKKDVDGVEYTYIKVEFPDREADDEKVGYVVKTFIKQKANCKFINDNTIIRPVITEITGLDDEKCCDFPTVNKPTHSYTSGMRKYKAGRDKGNRLHAACDLYRYKNEPVLSIAPGTVLRDKYYFYLGTYATEVAHDGGFVVRYGEINGTKVDGVEKGKKIGMSQRIGYMGVVNTGCCKPMLHFELYSGKAKGPLSQNANGKFQRRIDLMNPTDYLLKWEAKRF